MSKKYSTDPKLDKLVNSEDYKDRIKAAEQGYKLDKLVNDKNSDVRKAVNSYLKEHNYKTVFDWAKDNNVDIDLDEWLNSDDWIKRYIIARQGYRLDKLVNDEDWAVRNAAYNYLADHNYKSIFEYAKDNNIDLDIDEWLNSNSWTKRYAVAKQGYELNKLVNDEDWSIRNEVARQGYRLDKLVNDKDFWVRNTVDDYLKEHNCKSIFDWAKENNIDLDIDEWLNSDNQCKREQVTRQGYKLDKLVYDESVDVRCELAWQGYGLDILVNDKDWSVRRTVAHQGYDLDKLVNDEDIHVRIAVAYQGYGLDKLIKDEDYMVRKAVAWQGYGLDILINDENYEVREAVEDYLTEHNLTLDEWYIQNKKSPSAVQNLKDFVYKVDNSSKIKIETSYNSIDEFFEDISDKSYEDKESITVIAIDTKIPLIKLEKNKSKNKNVFKFIVDISIEDDDFIIRSIFDNKEKFDQLLQSTINALREYSQFSKYADELENYL